MQVAFVDMPFFYSHSCSSGIPLMKSYLNDLRIACKCFYFNLEFAEKLGFNLYKEIQEHDSLFDANWASARLVFPSNNSIEYVSKSNQNSHVLYRLRRLTEEYIKEVARRDWSKYKIIGFSTFPHQLNASLALGKILKERYPDTLIVYGGPSVLGSAGVEFAKHYPWMDVVFLGDADYAFPEFCSRLRDGMTVRLAGEGITGIALQNNNKVDFTYYADSVDMDNVAIPDFDDYIEAIIPYQKHPAFTDDYRFSIGFELSRGCSYGVKKNCTFCSFIETTGFQSHVRSPENALQILEEMYVKYSKYVDFLLCDILLPRHFPKTVFAPWTERKKQLDIDQNSTIWFDAKPWHTKEDIKHMKEIDVDKMHYGIEHLHPDAIQAMRKGQRLFQSLSVLKWSKLYKVRSEWSVLLQIPGKLNKINEEMRWNSEFTELIPKLHHLRPPTLVLFIAIMKGSPYSNERNEFDLPNLRPSWAYNYIFAPEIDKEIVTTYYDYDGYQGVFTTKTEKYELIIQAIDRWKEFYHSNQAKLVFNDDFLSITDTRLGNKIISIDEKERDILLFCDEPRKDRDLANEFGPDYLRTLTTLEEKGLILDAEFRWLTLVESMDNQDCVEEIDVEIQEANPLSLPVLN